MAGIGYPNRRFKLLAPLGSLREGWGRQQENYVQAVVRPFLLIALNYSGEKNNFNFWY
jgi:hypothetical protein